MRPRHDLSIRSVSPAGKKRKDDESRENKLTTGDIKESSRPCLAYAAQTESGDKVITIRGHVSIVRGVPE